MKPALLDIIKSQIRSSASVPSDNKGYVKRLTDNLLAGVRLEHFEQDLRNGGGRELENKFLALHSSSAFAINYFAPFRKDLSSLSILGKQCFRSFQFEKALPTGLKGTPPNLDVYLQGDEEVIGIESKFLEYYTPKVAHYSDSYSRQRLSLAEDCWWQVLEESKAAGPSHLDVAQLVKHYLGLIPLLNHGVGGWIPKEVTLLYLFWEPTNGHDIEECQSHRRDIEQLASKVSNSRVKLQSLTYPELWRSWERIPGIAAHVKNLQARYLLTLTIT